MQRNIKEPAMGQFLVSIRELKSRLSHYLRLTRKGESVVITDRGVPIGRIVPMGQDLDQRLAAMRETGQTQWSGRKLRRRRPVAKLRGRGSVASLLVEDRE
jgi:prevent-host-death family protein